VQDYLSSFGMRKHPIDGFNKMHRGTDFAAPTGTPIMASGNGTSKSWWWGRWVEIVVKIDTTHI